MITLFGQICLDITKDAAQQIVEDDDNYVYVSGDQDNLHLVIGNLKIKLSQSQLDKIQFYFENT